MKIKVITPPALEPMTRAEAKQHMGISSTHNDQLIDSAITQAREYCEAYQHKKFITQTLDLYLDAFPSASFIEFLSCSPVQSITSIKYTDYAGVEYTMPTADYSLDNVSFINKIDLNYNKSWPSVNLKPTNGVVIRFVAGYTATKVGDVTQTNLPQAIRWAMAMHLKALYDTHTPAERVDLERARDAILKMDRVMIL